MKLLPKVEYTTVRNILEGTSFEGKSLMLPTVQRTFVWNESRILDFLDSLYKGYPIGVITLLKTTQQFPSIPMEDGTGSENNSQGERFYIIDGQQRITSLLLMKNQKNGKNWELSRSGRSISRSYIGYTPEEKDAKFIRSRGRDVAEILRKSIDNQGIDDELGRNIAKKILDYQIPISIITLTFAGDEDVDELYEDIADMFIRINSSGMKIGSIEMFLAFFAGSFDKKNDVKLKINNIHEKLNEQYDIDLEPMLRFIFWTLGINQNAFSTKKFKGAINKLKENYKQESTRLFEEFDKCEEAMENSLKFLAEELGVNKSVVERFLPSQNILIPIFAHAYRNGGNIPQKYKDEVLGWFIVASFFSVYSQSTNNRIENDLGLFKEKDFPLHKLKNNMRNKKIKWEDLRDYDDVENADIKNQDNRVSRKATKNYQFLIYSLLHLNKATDFEGNPIKSNEKIDIHHIFPKAIIDNVEDDKKEEYSDLINDFSNITFISSTKNKEISDKRPEEYLINYNSKDLEKHFMPTDRQLFKIENCRKFLDKRARLIFECAKKFVNDKIKD